MVLGSGRRKRLLQRHRPEHEPVVRLRGQRVLLLADGHSYVLQSRFRGRRAFLSRHQVPNPDSEPESATRP
jgi:hypothetical protein